jgi:hypothetical protein
MSSFSSLLFAEPSFTEGLARTLDMGGTLTLHNESATPKQADFWAIYSDWRAVGQDIREAEMNEANRLLHR